MGFDMNGKTAGIIGTGKIARILIRILKGFGMNILAYDLHPDQRFAEEAGITYTTLDDLYARSDIISLHCPLTPETEHLINTDSIGKMKDGVMIINTGRGKLINTEMLIDGLKSKKVGAAGLDVYEEEGEYFYEDKSDRIIDDDTLARLLSFNNVILTSPPGLFHERSPAQYCGSHPAQHPGLSGKQTSDQPSLASVTLNVPGGRSTEIRDFLIRLLPDRRREIRGKAAAFYASAATSRRIIYYEHSSPCLRPGSQTALRRSGRPPRSGRRHGGPVPHV